MTTANPTKFSSTGGGSIRAQGGHIARKGVSLRAGGPSSTQGGSSPHSPQVYPQLTFLPTTEAIYHRGLALYREENGFVAQDPTSPSTFYIRSEEAVYTVDLATPTCGCRAFTYNPELSCKHMVAAGAMAVEMGMV